MIGDFETVAVSEPRPHVLQLLLNRPLAANAINTRMAEELLSFFGWLLTEAARQVRCVVVTGAGKAFCAGGDLKERRTMDDAQWLAQHDIMERAVRAAHDAPMPVVAAVNGAAFGGGCELALTADFIYAADDARFALTETGLGIMPGAGGTQNLPRAVGLARAKETIFTARPFTADEARQWGMVNALVPAERLHETVLDTAATIAANAPLAVRQAKKAMQLGLEMDRRTGLFFEIEAYNRLVSTRDRREGVDAFNEKRKPVFEGC